MKIKMKTMFLMIIVMMVSVRAQKIELIYTKAGVEQALAYKSTIQLKDATATNALSLMNISDVRKKAYLDGLAGFSAVLIFGDSGVKAVSTIDYNIPVIIVNSNLNGAAKGAVIRIFDNDYSGADAKGQIIADVNAVNFSKADLTSKKEINIKCQGINGALVAKKILSILSN